MKNYAIKKIITPTVLPLHDSAVTAWSEHLSKNFKAQLLLYNAIKPIESSGDAAKHGNVMNDLLKSALNMLQDLGDSLSQAHKVSYVVEVSNHWRNLIRQIQDENADLLITGMPVMGETTPGRLTALMYNSPCPVFFVREGMVPLAPKKILLPIRTGDGVERQLPVVIAWAKNFGASIFMSSFVPDGMPAKENLKLLQRAERMENSIRLAGIDLETETTHGFHFGTTMIQRAEQSGADLMAISVKPTNYITRLFTKMVGPFFLENASIPVLSLPYIAAGAAKPGNSDATATKEDPSVKTTHSAASMAV